jgi:ribosomal protein S20
LIKTGKKDDAAKAYQEMSSALDKAAKGGVIHKATASRKRGRLATTINKLK